VVLAVVLTVMATLSMSYDDDHHQSVCDDDDDNDDK